MTFIRMGFLLTVLTGIALLVVHLRAEQTRTAARIAGIQREWSELRHEWWSLQVRTARLRSPARIHEQITLMPAPLRAPGEERIDVARFRLASEELEADTGANRTPPAPQ